MEIKTNAMRILDKGKIPYQSYCYTHTNALSGVDVAEALGQNPTHVFKTLVTVGKSTKHYVFVIPVAEELDLKKAAASVSEKAVEMVKSKALFGLTGYVHGGCSPIGMKKFFTTRIDSSAATCKSLIFSAGKIGYQIELKLADLQKVISFELADLLAPRNS